MNTGFWAVLSMVPLLSKSQAQLVTEPVDVSVNPTVRGATPEVVFAENAGRGSDRNIYREGAIDDGGGIRNIIFILDSQSNGGHQ